MTPLDIIAKQYAILTYGFTADERPDVAAAEVIIEALQTAGFVIVPINPPPD
jgi:hypothetical protein